MKVAYAAIGIFAVRFALGAWFDPGRDGDIAWQQWLGLHILHGGGLPAALGPEAFAATGSQWVPQEWALSMLVAALLHTKYYALLAALPAIAAVLTMLVTGLAARRLGASTLATAIAVVCVAFSMLESFGIRAQVFAWALLAVLMYLLRCTGGRTQLWILPLVALWANLHASALLAPALLLLWTAGLALQDRAFTARVRHHALLVAGSLAAVCCTPLGLRLPVYALELMRSPIRYAINEWQPSDITATSFSLGALVLIVALCVLGVGKRRRPSEMLLFLAVSWMTFSALRNIPICAIVLAPLVAVRLTRHLPEHLRVNAIFAEKPVTALLYGGAVAGAVLAGMTLIATPKFTASDLPVRAIAALAAIDGSHNLYCEDFAWCSLALQYPNLREYLDGRCDPFPLPVWKDYQAIFAVTPNWRRIVERRGIDAIIVEKQRGLAKALPAWRSWRLAYSDSKFRLFVRER